ncbi:hypothetical protein ACE6H2_004698 [Prunus campanulata]
MIQMIRFLVSIPDTLDRGQPLNITSHDIPYVNNQPCMRRWLPKSTSSLHVYPCPSPVFPTKATTPPTALTTQTLTAFYQPPSSPIRNGHSFYSSSSAQNDVERVYAIGLCRGDINSDACRSCLSNSTISIAQACPNQKGQFYGGTIACYATQTAPYLASWKPHLVMVNNGDETLKIILAGLVLTPHPSRSLDHCPFTIFQWQLHHQQHLRHKPQQPSLHFPPPTVTATASTAPPPPKTMLKESTQSGSAEETLTPMLAVAVLWRDYCMLRYSNRSIRGFMEASPIFDTTSSGNVSSSDVGGFNRQLMTLLERLRGEAAAGGDLVKFAVGNVSKSNVVSQTIYGLAQ